MLFILQDSSDQNCGVKLVLAHYFFYWTTKGSRKKDLF